MARGFKAEQWYRCFLYQQIVSDKCADENFFLNAGNQKYKLTMSFVELMTMV